MKHLKEYNTYDDKIEDLSEYLQEVFDKYHIQQFTEDITVRRYLELLNMNHIKLFGKWFMGKDETGKYGVLIIHGYTPGLANKFSSNDIYNDIVKIQSNIELRLDRKMHIQHVEECLIISFKL